MELKLHSPPPCPSLNKFYVRMKSRTDTHLEEFGKLVSQLITRRKYLEQQIKDEHLKKIFVESLNQREIILLELNQCCETEKDLFVRLNNL